SVHSIASSSIPCTSSVYACSLPFLIFFFQAEDGIRARTVTGVQTCALPIYLYSTFLEKQRGFGVSATSTITIVYAIGMICGGTVIGFLSQRWGRRRCIILSAICGIFLIPAWIFSPGTPLLIAGGFLMQFMVQGAWGVVPVHLN